MWFFFVWFQLTNSILHHEYHGFKLRDFVHDVAIWFGVHCCRLWEVTSFFHFKLNWIEWPLFGLFYLYLRIAIFFANYKGIFFFGFVNFFFFCKYLFLRFLWLNLFLCWFHFLWFFLSLILLLLNELLQMLLVRIGLQVFFDATKIKLLVLFIHLLLNVLLLFWPLLFHFSLIHILHFFGLNICRIRLWRSRINILSSLLSNRIKRLRLLSQFVFLH